MKKYILVFIVGLFFIGCAMTSSQVAEQVNKQQQLQYQEYVKAKAEAIKLVMETLSKIDRGGMKIELDSDGKVKAIKYTERLDMDVLKQALITEQPKMFIPKSGIQEFGDFFMKFGSFATPIASLWLNYKTTKSNNWANVEITKSNNEAQVDMYNAFTSNFKNEIITNNSVVSTTIEHSKENNEVTIEKENFKEEVITSEKETTYINNNEGGNQNIGETNTIIPYQLSSESFSSSIDNVNKSEKECLPGTICK